jgi:hypothetical protein
MIKKKGFALICFYEASTGGHGSAEVTKSVYECLTKKNKKIFEIKKKKIFEVLEYYKLNFLENIFKIFYIPILFKEVVLFINKFEKKIIIIEGASWIGYSYLFIKLVKLFYTKITIIYHAHNIEYDLRKSKNNFIIAFFSKIFEEKVYKLADFSTVVSSEDKKKIKKLYNTNTYIFSNGINRKKLIAKKPKFKIPKKFIIFSGSYSYFYNKLAINKIIYKIMPRILKKDKEVRLIITGKDFPKKQFNKYTFIDSYINLDKENLNYLIKKSLFMLTPMSSSPGTKLKAIETLLLGANLVTTKSGVKGIETLKSNNLFIYYNYKQLFNFIDHLIINKKNIKNNKIYLKYFIMENIVKKFFSEIKL